MNTCIVGAGALGGFIGARLALAGAHPTLIDRDEQLNALRRSGLQFVEMDGSVQVTRAFRTTETCQEAGVHDLVLLCVKAYDLPSLALDLSSLIGPQTVVLTLQNGIPWWYFQRHGGAFEGTRLRSADPVGALTATIDPGQIIGCVAYPAASADGPGHVRHVEGERFALGEIDGRLTDRLAQVADLLETGGFRARPIEDIRAELWHKALGSVSFNPISALTGGTMAEICRHPESRALVRRMMEEAESIAGRLGIQLRRTIDERLAGAEAVGEHKTSMLQDLEAGRRLEMDALVGTVLELGRLVDVPTPAIASVDACLRLRVETLEAQRDTRPGAGRGTGRRVRRVS
jgi:2-dehydropantoate 2-reductase